jgi:hypothetical protein
MAEPEDYLFRDHHPLRRLGVELSHERIASDAEYRRRTPPSLLPPIAFSTFNAVESNSSAVYPGS